MQCMFYTLLWWSRQKEMVTWVLSHTVSI